MDRENYHREVFRVNHHITAYLALLSYVIYIFGVFRCKYASPRFPAQWGPRISGCIFALLPAASKFSETIIYARDIFVRQVHQQQHHDLVPMLFSMAPFCRRKLLCMRPDERKERSIKGGVGKGPQFVSSEWRFSC